MITLEGMRGSTKHCSIRSSSSPGKVKYFLSLAVMLADRSAKPRPRPQRNTTKVNMERPSGERCAQKMSSREADQRDKALQKIQHEFMLSSRCRSTHGGGRDYQFSRM